MEKVKPKTNRIFCLLNYPEKKYPFTFSKTEKEETALHFEEIIRKSRNGCFGMYDVSPEKDVALSLPNHSIGFHSKIIEMAKNSYQGKFLSISAGFHEFGHEKGYISYKNENYFKITPPKFGYEAGNFVQKHCFNGSHNSQKLIDNEEVYKETLDFLLINSNYYFNDLQEIMNPLKWEKKGTIDQKTSGKNLITKMEIEEENYERCPYSELRNSFVENFCQLYGKK